jgi:hypothetical protein
MIVDERALHPCLMLLTRWGTRRFRMKWVTLPLLGDQLVIQYVSSVQTRYMAEPGTPPI